ncbi:MAG: hypothetical protein K8U57_15595 [Planctomycetes bacterium]|nr:hypothetical protein [Planctomycetota bacterium]
MANDTDEELKAKLRRLLRVRGEIAHQGDTVPAELDALIEQVVGQIAASRETAVIAKNRTKRQLPTGHNSDSHEDEPPSSKAT